MGRCNIDWDAQPLGEVTDVELAERLGCHWSTAAKQRQRRGIDPCADKRYHQGAARARHNECEKCGEQASDKFRGRWLCRACLCPDYEHDVTDYCHYQSSMALFDELERPPQGCEVRGPMDRLASALGVPRGATPRELDTAMIEAGAARKKGRR